MYHMASRMVFRYRQWTQRRTAPQKIANYIQAHEVRKLQLGCGPNVLAGWLNTTLQPIHAGAIHLNALKPFPIADAVFHYIFSEHMIEHLTFQQGQSMLRECFRVMQHGGRIRLATPDLAKIIALYTHSADAEPQAYNHWLLDTFMQQQPTDNYNPCFAVNKMFYGWDKHIFIYDYRTLCYALEQAGFTEVIQCQPGASADGQLQGIEHHGQVLHNEAMNRYETLVVEARKP
jgi:predicted SAM-dependent methyltransferase